MIKKIYTIFVLILVSILIAPSVLAGVTFTSITYDDTTADVGTSRTISVAMRTTSSGESSTITDISLSGGLTTVSSPSTPFTVTYTPVTKSFTVRSDTAATYSFAITVVDSNGNSYSSSSDLGSKTLEYVNPSSLSLSVVEDPSGTYNAGDRVGIVVDITNLLSSAQTRNLTLWFTSGTSFSVSGDPQIQTLSLSASQTKQVIWNVTLTGLSGTKYAYIRLGDNTQAATITFTATSATTTTTSAAGGGGGLITAETGKITKTFSSITTTTPKTIIETELKDSKTDFTEMYIAVKQTISNVKLTIESLSSKPADTTDIAETVYKYIKITKENIDDSAIDKATIKFKISISWITDNSIDQNSVFLLRYSDNKWNKMNTTRLSSDNDYIYYKADIPGFSYFAIAGEKISATTTITTTTVPTVTTTTTIIKMPEIEEGGIWIIAIVIIIIIIIIIVLRFYRPKIV